MRTDWYQRAFPRARIDKAKDTESEVRTTERGYRLATSVGGTLTGRGGDIIIIDDPIKPQDAQSKSVREKTVQWYENTLLSRLRLFTRPSFTGSLTRLYARNCRLP
jgi:hypothetical protein